MPASIFRGDYRFKVVRSHPAQPVNPVHFRYSPSADQVGDKAHDFCELCVHAIKTAIHQFTQKQSAIVLKLKQSPSETDLWVVNCTTSANEASQFN